MTTKSDKPISRETSAYVRERGQMRAVIATIHGSILELRPKGMRNRETLDIGSLYHYAIKSRVLREKMEKAKERKARKGR